MSLTIELAPEMEISLCQAARLRGMQPTEYVRHLLEENLPSAQDLAVADLMEAWREEDATADPVERDAREAEWQELKASLNAHRKAAGERVLFP